MITRILKHVTLLLIFLTACSASFASEVQGQFNRFLQVSGSTSVVVNSNAGRITIAKGNDNEISIEGHVRINSSGFKGDPNQRLAEVIANPPILQVGNRLVIGQEKWSSAWNFAIDYDIKMPAGADVSANTGAGEIRITGIPHISRASSGAGNVIVKDVATALTASTGSGHIEIQGQPVADWRVHSGAGGIILDVGPDAKFTFVADSGSGAVRIQVPALYERPSGWGWFHVKGQANGGGPVIRASTGAGEVRIR